MTATTALPSLPSPPEMYQALVDRDPAYDGLFIVGVRTTGIFCRPTCPARKPRAGNVEYFPSARDALHAGYRPCRRCRPMDGTAKPPEWVERVLAAVERDPARRLTDQDLRAMSIEPARARRYFKSKYGMTFHAYHRARRMGLALSAIRTGRSRNLDHIGLDHGFESMSGFRDAFAKVFGAPPGGRGGRSAGPCLLARWFDTPLGGMVAVASAEGLCLLEFVDRRALQTELEQLRHQFAPRENGKAREAAAGATIVPGDNEHLDAIARDLAAYFDGTLDGGRFGVTLDLRHATPFQDAVWHRLLEIPHGETLSYAAMATDIGRPGAQRAVGRANGQNRLAIVIPCHRVVRSDGTLCGYGGGLWRKKWLLEHEGKRR